MTKSSGGGGGEEKYLAASIESLRAAYDAWPRADKGQEFERLTALCAGFREGAVHFVRDMAGAATLKECEKQTVDIYSNP